jgi:Ubiquitin-2 like Rad60 SUMO-like
VCFGVAGWAEEAVAKAEILRLIYQGRFLHSNVTLGALGLPLGKTTVMHLVPRENLPEPNSQGRYTLHKTHYAQPKNAPNSSNKFLYGQQLTYL